jgi:hypothetical protein
VTDCLLTCSIHSYAKPTILSRSYSQLIIQSVAKMQPNPKEFAFFPVSKACFQVNGDYSRLRFRQNTSSFKRRITLPPNFLPSSIKSLFVLMQKSSSSLPTSFSSTCIYFPILLPTTSIIASSTTKTPNAQSRVLPLFTSFQFNVCQQRF